VSRRRAESDDHRFDERSTCLDSNSPDSGQAVEIVEVCDGSRSLPEWRPNGAHGNRTQQLAQV